MVGVPLSRGCQTCRKRKIKCDETHPKCTRCKKSGLLCLGYKSRLKFMDEGPKLQKKPRQPQRLVRQDVPRTLPSSASENLSLQLCQTFRSDLPAVKNLRSFTKTYFVNDLPRHVGLSTACDLAMKALCLAHSTLLSSCGDSFVRSRIQYGLALTELQHCLADSRLARTTGTLCATMILGIIEQLLHADFRASIRHAGGAARLIEVIGISHFDDPFAYGMFHAFQGAIVVESILYQRGCFLDSPLWRGVCERTQTPFSALFSLLSQFPEFLSALRDLKEKSSDAEEDRIRLREKIVRLRNDLLIWRFDPAYTELFHTISHHAEGFLEKSIIYTSSKSLSLLITYSAMMILINAALLVLSGVEAFDHRAENLVLARQICQSYENSRKFLPVGSVAIDFSFRAAYLVSDSEQRGWIAEKLCKMQSSLCRWQDDQTIVVELDSCFDYLAY
ncbi:uncharacterized protein LY89DRAFT_715501 [Mollisia scopiformis]|uniref:Zn(2)-C6 fungal-type domain-containing protein n=1 Tax=Mollisia scopiformis TaxID=149040 RepID=A0A194XLY8_MOLSC|nr:uncharacterized protein LY89DRAFT_715501 [Mollisia scopiformis]KUJ21260.1 hypothetical protein LY89DRAFT_715501 [Mollisia scopiformis]